MTDPPRSDGSVSQNLRRVSQDADPTEAQEQLFSRYYQHVLNKAQHRLQRLTVVDTDDVAVSVWDTILRGLADGRHVCRDRQDFENLLAKITLRKAINLYRWAQRPRRHPATRLSNEEVMDSYELPEPLREIATRYYLQGESAASIAESLGTTLSQIQHQLEAIRRWLQKHRYRPDAFGPALAAEMIAENERPMDTLLFEELILSLEPKLRETVLLKLRGMHNRDIALALDVTERTVERRLQLLKSMLHGELDDEATG